MANWETFVPDLIVGVVTGAVVGLVVLGYERLSAARRRREDARTTSLRIVHPLLLALQRPIYVWNYSSVLPLPQRWARALELVEASDLDSWHHVAPTDLTRVLLRFRSRLWDLRADAEDLIAAVDRWDRLQARDPKEVEYGLALILEGSGSVSGRGFPRQVGARGVAQWSGASGGEQDGKEALPPVQTCVDACRAGHG